MEILLVTEPAPRRRTCHKCCCRLSPRCVKALVAVLFLAGLGLFAVFSSLTYRVAIASSTEMFTVGEAVTLTASTAPDFGPFTHYRWSLLPRAGNTTGANATAEAALLETTGRTHAFTASDSGDVHFRVFRYSVRASLLGLGFLPLGDASYALNHFSLQPAARFVGAAAVVGWDAAAGRLTLRANGSDGVALPTAGSVLLHEDGQFVVRVLGPAGGAPARSGDEAAYLVANASLADAFDHFHADGALTPASGSGSASAGRRMVAQAQADTGAGAGLDDASISTSAPLGGKTLAFSHTGSLRVTSGDARAECTGMTLRSTIADGGLKEHALEATCVVSLELHGQLTLTQFQGEYTHWLGQEQDQRFAVTWRRVHRAIRRLLRPQVLVRLPLRLSGSLSESTQWTYEMRYAAEVTVGYRYGGAAAGFFGLGEPVVYVSPSGSNFARLTQVVPAAGQGSCDLHLDIAAGIAVSLEVVGALSGSVARLFHLPWYDVWRPGQRGDVHGTYPGVYCFPQQQKNVLWSVMVGESWTYQLGLDIWFLGLSWSHDVDSHGHLLLGDCIATTCAAAATRGAASERAATTLAAPGPALVPPSSPATAHSSPGAG